MDRDEEQVNKQSVVLLSYLVLGVISMIIFAIYWCGCRQRGIPGVVLGIPNSVQPNTVVVPFQNATGPSNVGPPYVVSGFHTNVQGAPYPVAVHVDAQYPAALSGASGTGASIMNHEAPPAYNRTQPEQVPLVK
ncbi:unnamed protein product [Arctia plantaginis]|uniref:Uncharacterized protein n=1 Tax=Arctia plantaginis TaxID=874455 RepID=A0A8S1A0Q5_ARCPL|nr:unnamed protein product [Arctia plantaginis]